MATKPKTMTEIPAEEAKILLVNHTTGELVTQEEAYAEYETDAGSGFEGQTQEDVGIPFLVLMQPLSPEVSAEGSAIKPGAWINRGTGDVFQAGVDFIPAHTKHIFREWSSRDPSGSAPLGDYMPDDPMIQQVRSSQPFGDYSNPNAPDHPLVETFEVYGLVIGADESFMPAVVTFSSTHIKAYRDFMLRARSLIIKLPNGRKINPPLFSHVYTFRSKRVEKRPHTWYVPEISFKDPAGAEKSRLLPLDDLYQAAKQLHIAILEGSLKAAAPTRGDSTGNTADASRTASSTDSEQAPY